MDSLEQAREYRKGLNPRWDDSGVAFVDAMDLYELAIAERDERIKELEEECKSAQSQLGLAWKDKERIRELEKSFNERTCSYRKTTRGQRL